VTSWIVLVIAGLRYDNHASDEASP
jgi:hypothetical protein